MDNIMGRVWTRLAYVGPLTLLLLSLLCPSGAQSAVVKRALPLPEGVRLLENPPPGNTTITLQAYLAFANLNLLEPTLQDVSDPKSPSYGRYWTQLQAEAMFRGTDSVHEAAVEWLTLYNVTDKKRNGFTVDFTTTVELANGLLNADFRYFDIGGGETKLRTLQYSLPETLESHIDFIYPALFDGRKRAAKKDQSSVSPAQRVKAVGYNLAIRRLRSKRQDESHPCGYTASPNCLNEMYNIQRYEPYPRRLSRVGFTAFLNQSAREYDYHLYREIYRVPESELTTVLLNGGENHQSEDQLVAEASMDMQILSAVARGLPITQYIVGGRPPFIPNEYHPTVDSNANEPYLEFFDYLSRTPNDEIPQVISISYSDDEQTVPADYAVRVCRLAALLGLRGITLVAASGDHGPGDGCVSNDGEQRKELVPGFPASCPYVTAVGGTVRTKDGDSAAWRKSGGGFSNYFGTPWYQQKDVEGYVNGLARDTKAHLSKHAKFIGRAYPDLAAHSTDPMYTYYDAGFTTHGGGTSAAAAVVGGLFGLLNDARLTHKRPAMGFINPWLYSQGREGLRDITRGYSDGCRLRDPATGEELPDGSVVKWAKWNATEGWDPTTGLGVPNFDDLKWIAEEAEIGAGPYDRDRGGEVVFTGGSWAP